MLCIFITTFLKETLLVSFKKLQRSGDCFDGGLGIELSDQEKPACFVLFVGFTWLFEQNRECCFDQILSFVVATQVIYRSFT